MPPTSTSDVLDAALSRQRSALEALRKAPPAVGRRALDLFKEGPVRPEPLRLALLEVAARADPEEVAPLLEHLLERYDPEMGLAVRLRAAELLAETAPRRALAVLEPLVLESTPSATRPPQELLVRSWARAAELEGLADARVLSRVATDLHQTPEARYAAIGALGRFRDPLAVRALKEVLEEASSDGLMRRKAVQALESCLPPAELCPLLEEAVEHQHDPDYLVFVAEVIDRLCP